MKNFFSKYDSFFYFVVAILSLITYFVRQSDDNTIWLVLCFFWLSMGFTNMARRKKNRKK